MSRTTAGPLTGLLSLLAAGPLVAGLLPAGPGGLLAPAPAAVGAAAVILFFTIFVWPARGTGGERRSAVLPGLEILLVGLPFVTGLALVAGRHPAEIGRAAAVLGGTVFATGAWIAGPGRRRERDRLFAAGALLLLVAIPLGNYVLNEFGAAGGGIGYRVSPVLAVRAILLRAPTADPVPCLLVLVALGAAFAGARLVRRPAVAVALLLLCGGARGEEVEAVFGPAYVRGRPLVLRVTGGEAGAEVAVRVPGRGRTSARNRAGGVVLAVPGAPEAAAVQVRQAVDWTDAGLAARPVEAGTLLVSIGAVPGDVDRAAADAGFTVSGAPPGAESLAAGWFLAADGVIDVSHLLPEETATRLARAGLILVRDPADLPAEPGATSPVRRPWEESGGELGADDLDRLFPVREREDGDRPIMAFAVLALFAACVIVTIGFASKREVGAGVRLVLLGGISLATLVALLLALPSPPPVTVEAFVVDEAGRKTELVLFRTGDDGGVAIREFEGFPLVLGRVGGADVRVLARDRFRLRMEIGPHERRIAVVSTPAAGEPGEGLPDLLVSPAGLARPGEAYRPAGEFLREHFRGDPGRPDPRQTALRKLVRLGNPPEGVHAIRFTAEGLSVRPAR